MLSEGWIKLYMEAWNGDESLVQSLAPLSGVVEYGILGTDHPHVQIEVKDGKILSAGKKGDKEADFVLESKADMWKKIAMGKQGVKTALVTKKIKFKGPLSLAMKLIGGLTNSLLLFGKVDTDWDV
ncbi:SCP-2 sterol transfer family protein [delta proteobacterium NaphS2]|nr:SCP-2 sterol transfer family protein [delta proteobacterium NaphS2]